MATCEAALHLVRHREATGQDAEAPPSRPSAERAERLADWRGAVRRSYEDWDLRFPGGETSREADRVCSGRVWRPL